MTPSNEDFLSYEPIAPRKFVQTADRTLLPVTGIGTMIIRPIGIVTNVFYIPKLCTSLVSVQRLAKVTNYSILFNNCDVYLCLKDQGLKIGLAKFRQGLYYFHGSSPRTTLFGNGTMAASVWEPSRTTLLDINQRMSQPFFHLLKQM